jgi:predicted amidohydrolase YtcJ
MAAAQAKAPGREILFCGGPVITMDDHVPSTDNVVVRDGRIAEVGVAGSDLQALRERAEVVDLQGRALVPGFIDAHNHFSFAALEPMMADCRTPPHESIHGVLDALRRACEQAPPGAWVRGWGFHASQVAEQRNPTRWELDEVSPANPVFLVDASYHAGYANSAALRIAGIARGSPDPVRGMIERDPRGEATGTLLEAASDLPQHHSVRSLLDRAPDRGTGLIAAAGRRHLELGITAVGDALVTPDAAELYRECARAGLLPLTVMQIHGGDTFFARPRLDDRSVTAMHRAEGRMLRAGAVKIFMDPAYPSPAVDRPCGAGCIEHAGETNYSAGEIETIALAAASADLDVVIHCGGNRAVDLALGAFEAVRRSHGAKDLRLRVEHAFIAHTSQAPRMADLGVSLVAQPGLGSAFGALFDSWRGSDDPSLVLFPVRSMLEAGVRVAASSDNPCGGPLDPLDVMRCAVSREGVDGQPVELHEAVTPMQALRMYTADAADACGLGDEQGSISPGKRANLVVLSRDPTCSSTALVETRVLATYIGGAPAHGPD